MNKNKTKLVLVVDRSGSMADILSDAQGGINTFLKTQKEHPGECSLSLYQFNNMVEKVYSGDLKNCEGYHLTPSGGTALFDAMGQAIQEVGRELALMHEEDRPGLVLFAVVTDGEENSSREYSAAKVKNMVEEQKTKYSWKFEFMCCDEKTLNQAQSLGFNSATQYNVQKTANVYKNMGGKFAAMRSLSANNATNDQLEAAMSYNDEQKSDMA